MWIIKAKGESYYVEHVDCKIGWSTKETPDNSHTKGSIKIKHCLLVIADDNCAYISELTEHDKIRLRNRERGITRIITKWGGKLRDVLKGGDIKHGPIKTIGGGCGATFSMVDILKQEHVSYLLLMMADTDARILKENEAYYRAFDDPKFSHTNDINEEDMWELYEGEDDQ